MCDIALTGALVVMFDLPSHGRSDGLLGYISSWWDWVERVWQVLDTIVPDVKTNYPSAKKIYGGGVSLGGGLTACLALQRPDFFDGVILIAPMLAISENVKPPKAVQDVFRTLFGPMQLSWPVTPSKDLNHFTFRDLEHCQKFKKANPFGMKGLKPRLATAYAFGFVFPEWMEEHMAELSTPFLVIHGTADKVTDPEMSKRLYEVAASTDKEIKLYDDAWHDELLNCTPGVAEYIEVAWQPEQASCTERCLKDMSMWMAVRSPGSSQIMVSNVRADRL